MTVVLATAMPLSLLVLTVANFRDLPWFPRVVAFVGPVLMAWHYANLSIELSLSNGRSLESRSLLRKISVAVTAIVEIDARRWNRGFISIRTPRTTITLYRDAPGALEAMREVARMNPAIRLRE